MVEIKSPDEFFGHQLGADRKIARWDKIVEYFWELDKSDMCKVVDVGPSTEGHPFLVVYISSPENLKDLEKLRDINEKITHPGDLSEDEIKALIAEGRSVVVQSMSLHASEIGGAQMAPELAYEQITRMDEEAGLIRDNVISIIVPSFNPDGQIMVTDWYNEWLDTEYEGVGTPFLYHKYSGHDNNRDAFMTNLIESQYMAKLMFIDWHPHAYQDHHHMGSYGARLFVAPYSDPIHPHGDPLVWRELSWYGAHMAYKLEEAGKTGILNGAVFSGWGHLGFHWLSIYHNIPSMLTESASAKLATPLYIHPEQLIEQTKSSSLVGTRMFPNYNPSTLFPHPWPGGWWTLRDIVEQQKISAWSLLEHMARNRETILWNAYQKAIRQTERGAQGSPQVYIIPADQHDYLTAELLIEKLLGQGIEVYRVKEPFTSGNKIYEAGSYMIPLAQPKMGLIHTLLGKTRFPDDEWTRQGDGTPHRPYDTATDTLYEFFGVTVEPADIISDTEIEAILDYKRPTGIVDDDSTVGYLMDTRMNASFKAVNMLLKKKVPIKRVTEILVIGDHELPPGCFIVEPGHEKVLKKIAEETGVDLHALESLEAEMKTVKQLKIGMYQRYWGGNMDEGWTRLCLEQFSFPYTTLKDKDILEGDLTKYDVIILPHDPPAMITGGDELRKWWKENRPTRPLADYPPEYQSGLGDEGKEKLREWVEKGGYLVCLGSASEYAIDILDLKVANAMNGLSTNDYHCPGSTLHVDTEIYHPIGFGMPEDTLVLQWNTPAFKILPSPDNHKYYPIATYPDSDILESGWLIGEKHIANKIAVLEAEHGDGKALLIGPRVQHRCQTHGTFKLLFNALIG